MGILICLAGFALAFAAGRRSLGAGLCVVLTVGYAYGMVRAQVPDAAAYFAFDAALLGFYAASFGTPSPGAARSRGRAALVWTLLLCAWPVLLFVLPDAGLLVRLVGLRAAVLLVPMVVLGARARTEDLRLVGTWLLALNVGAFAVGALEYAYGLEPFIPRVAATELIYRSADVRAGGQTFLRIPSVFSSAHAFGGTMVASLPLLLVAFAARRSGASVRAVTFGAVAVLATLLGVFLCGARQPAVMLALLVGLAALRGGLRRQTLWLVFLAGLGVALVVGATERLQRFLNLRDTDAALARMSISVNSGFLDLFAEHPFGRGLGSAVGTSMPAFLKEEMPAQVGLESEYSRLLVEQGVIGLALWVGLVLWLAARRVEPPSRALAPACVAMQALCVATWVSALIGTGTLTSIPQSALVLLQMGVVAGGRRASRAAPLDPSIDGRCPIVARAPPAGWTPLPRADRADQADRSEGADRPERPMGTSS